MEDTFIYKGFLFWLYKHSSGLPSDSSVFMFSLYLRVSLNYRFSRKGQSAFKEPRLGHRSSLGGLLLSGYF